MAERYSLIYCTDKGRRRPSNQDSLCVKSVEKDGRQLVLAAVCDGVGGLSGGEKASGAMAKALARWFDGHLAGLFGGDVTRDAVRESLRICISDACDTIWNYGQKKELRLGTTAAILLALDGKFLACNVGDSRIYALSPRGTRQISHDHSLVARLTENGTLTPEQAQTDPRRNILTQAIGAAPSVRPEFYGGETEKGGALLLCSDGFYHTLPAAELAARLLPVVPAERRRQESALRACLDDAMGRGEDDNISCVLLCEK